MSGMGMKEACALCARVRGCSAHCNAHRGGWRRVEGGANSVLRLFKEFRYNSGSADNRITLDEFKTCLKGMAIMVRDSNPQPVGWWF